MIVYQLCLVAFVCKYPDFTRRKINKNLKFQILAISSLSRRVLILTNFSKILM